MKLILTILIILTPLLINAQSYKSYANAFGEWNNVNLWETDAPPTTIGNGSIVYIDGTIYSESSIDMRNNGEIFIGENDTLLILGNLNTGNNTNITISSGGVLVIYGDYQSNNNLDIHNSGIILVYGNMTISNNTSINISNGSLYVFGSNNIDDSDLTGSYKYIGDNDDFLLAQENLSYFLNFTFPDYFDFPFLPIDLISFTSENIDESIYIKWITGSEVNNDFFELFKSIDGIEDWFKLVTKAGSGNSSIQNEYSYKDIDIIPNTIHYYKLIQTDYDGTQSESNIISILPNRVLCQFKITDNYIKIKSIKNIEYKIVIYDILGKSIYDNVVTSGSNILLKNELNPGSYIIKVECDSYISIHKFTNK